MKEMRFKDYPLKNDIKRALSELGFKSPLEVQVKVMPEVTQGKDVVVKSQTGSGKTAAFAIPICDIIEIEDKYPQALILAPTRELADQIKEDIDNIGRYRGIKTLAVYGKTSISEQRRALKNYPHIVVATPGRLMDLLDRKFLRTNDIKYFVMDEADELMNMGFEEQIHFILERMPRERNTLLFSATMPKSIEHIIMDDMSEPVRIDIKSEVDIHKKVDQIYYEVEEHKKLDFLKKMLDYEKPTKCIIFANTQNKVESIYSVMRKWNDETGTLHGGMEQEQRMKMISRFKRGELKYLIATDLASRGLHVRNLSHVINFNLPFENENYVHRIGRTGRVNNEGIAITLCSYKENERLPELEEYLDYALERKGPKRRVNHSRAESGKKKRFKADKKVKFDKIKIHAGRNSRLKAGDILGLLKRAPGVDQNDVGRIDLSSDFTMLEINRDKTEVVFRYLRNSKIGGKQHRIQKIVSKRY